ncbi:MAG: hypothetical protein JRJ56_06930 [Deltaproteobacteria bacterium]|nr:hypothetical protein [Deltaproteobacteria bacterium]
MDQIISEHFHRLHREVADRTGELSAICELLELAAARFDASRQEAAAGIMEIVLRHTGADSVILSWQTAGNGTNEPEPLCLSLTAAGAPEVGLAAAKTLLTTATPAAGEPRRLGEHSFLLLPLTAAGERLGCLGIGHRQQDFFSPARLRFINLLHKELGSIFLLFDKQKKLLAAQKSREQLKQFFSPEIVPEIFAATTDLPGVKTAAATILFADLRGFSSLTETGEAGGIACLLNCFYREMSRIVFSWQGTLERFVGDGFLALFGAPTRRSDDPWRALQAAIQMQQQWQQQTIAADGPPLAVGIHSGEVMAGFLGTGELLTYTAVGDPVNTCHRITTIAAGNQILVSAATVRQLEQSPHASRLAGLLAPCKQAQSFRGMRKALDLYQVVGQPAK